ncbi:alpha/beta fold hydrolase [uncultured Thiodictyon sp.]|uniref:alpha/beta fold hydrolase n=1 Tax=uncultured Thiodictyon sp. TaxID=1846217 RepID=UPI0025D4626B|nr:alpha/beta fold hydrolase [uncultured Thiodictyon sp.]
MNTSAFHQVPLRRVVTLSMLLMASADLYGRSSQPWSGNDMDTYADDLKELIEALDLTGVTLIGFSAGGGEVARYIGRAGCCTRQSTVSSW